MRFHQAANSAVELRRPTCQLYCIGVFKNGHDESGLLELVGGDPFALILTTHMKKAHAPAAQGRASTLCAVDFDVLAARNIIEGHRLSQRNSD